MTLEALAAAFLISSMFGCLIIRGALTAILQLNVGRKHKYQGVKKQQSLLACLFMNYMPRYIQSRRTLCIVLLAVNCVYMIVMGAFISLYLLALFGLQVLELMSTLFWIKTRLLDIPILVFFVVCTGHDKKHGGVEWKL